MRFLEKAVGFNPQTMKVKTEFIAALTTFLALSYILAVNPMVLGTTGMDKGALFSSTAIASAIATLLLAFMAKLPFAQAPGAGLNAFFAFTLCSAMGLTWQQALAVLLVEGILFIAITFMNIREKILDAIPASLRYAITAGIGMFIAFIGLRNANIVIGNEATLVHFGGFTPTAILGSIGILISAVMMYMNVKGSLFWGIIIVTIIGIPFGVTQIEGGWMPVSMPQSIEPIFCKFDFSQIFSFKVIIAIFSLLLVNIFDTLGTLMALADKTGIVKPDGSIPRIKEAMLSDAIGTTCGAFLGNSTITTYIESASGVAEGGKSGLTSLFIGIFFLLALFLSPIFLLIPGAATTGALVMVGALMLDSVRKIDFSDITDVLPAFIIIITMPLCYSIADGICLGLLSYTVVKLLAGKFKSLNPTLIIVTIFLLIYYIFG